MAPYDYPRSSHENNMDAMQIDSISAPHRETQQIGQGATTNSKHSRRRDLNWEEHKARLRTMYLENNQKLEDIMGTMHTHHDFVASVEQYKKRFRKWGWQKNLPYDKALWMLEKANKRKRDDNKKTEFVFGGMRWNEERISNSAKRLRKQETAPNAIALNTPADVTYETPQALTVASPQVVASSRRRARDIETISLASSAASSAQGKCTPEVLAIAWHGLTKPELDGMLGGTDYHIRTGDLDAAGQMLRQVWEGYQALLGPIHDEVKSVAYRLASFYAEQDKMNFAHDVLDEMSRLHVEKLGVNDRRTWQHVLHVVELLNAWNKPIEALSFLARAKDYVGSESTTRSTRNSRGKKRTQSLAVAPVTTHNLKLLEAAQSIVLDQSPEQIDNSLELARSYVVTSDEAVQPLLLAILQQCEFDTDRFAIQRLKTCTELLKLYVKQGVVWDNIARLEDASQAFEAVLINYPWDTKKFKSLEVMEALLELAAALLRCGRDGQAERHFRDATSKAEDLFGVDDECTIWMLISVGLVYQSTKGWDLAQQWFQQALAAALAGFPDKDGVTRSLEAAMEKEHFAYLNDEGRPFKTVFGVNGITVRPGRLHIE